MTPISIVLALSLSGEPASPQERPVREPTRDPTTVAELYDAYCYLGLPLSPKGSYLVKEERYDYSSLRSDWIEVYLALIRNDSDKEQFRAMTRAEPHRDLLSRCKIPPANMRFNKWIYQSEWFVFAAQAHHLGWQDAAAWAFQHAREEGFDSDSRTPLLDWLKDTAWEVHRTSILERSPQHRRRLSFLSRCLRPGMTELYDFQIQDLPRIQRSFRTQWRRDGTPEDVMEGIVRGQKTVDDLLAFGFEAIPVLIRSITDDRYTTQTARGGINNGTFTRYLTLGELSCDVLSQLSGNRFSLNRLLSENATIQDMLVVVVWQAMEWQKELRFRDERAWCREQLVIHWTDEQESGIMINRAILSIVCSKYPDDLPALLASCRHPVSYAGGILNAVANSRMTLTQKRAVFQVAAAHPQVWHPFDLIFVSSSIDPVFAKARFREMIAHAEQPADYIPQYYSDYASLMIVDWLFEFNEPASWSRFESFLPKFPPSIRFAMIQQFFLHRDPDRPVDDCKPAISCLMKLIDDVDGCPVQYVPPPKDLTPPRTLGHLAQVRLAELIGYVVPAVVIRDAEDSSEYREELRAAAKRALARPGPVTASRSSRP